MSELCTVERNDTLILVPRLLHLRVFSHTVVTGGVEGLILLPYVGLVGFLWHHLFESSIVQMLDFLKRVCVCDNSRFLLSAVDGYSVLTLF